MNRLFRYLLIALGEGILIAAIILLFPEGKTDLMILDICALSIAYLANVCGYPTLIRQDDENETAGYGVAWSSTWLYSAAVVIAVAVFYWMEAAFAWQVLAQCILLFFFLSGIYWARVVSKHAGKLEKKYKTDAQGVEQLKAKARMLQAVLTDNMDEATKQELISVIERTGYLIPNRSTLAFTLEKQIHALFDQLSEAVVTRQSDEKISSLTEQCKSALKQRMAIPN